MHPKKVGKVQLEVRGLDGRANTLILENVFYIRELPVNVVSGGNSIEMVTL